MTQLRLIFFLIVAKAVSGDVYHVRLFTSDIAFAGTNATIAVEIHGHVPIKGKRTVKLRFKNDLRNSVTTGSGVLDQGIYPPEAIKTTLLYRGSIPDAWHVHKVAVRKSGVPHWFVFPLNKWLGYPGFTSVWSHESHTEDYVAGVTWEVRVFTGDVDGAGTVDDVTLQIVGHGQSKRTRDLVMKGEKKRNSMRKYYFDTVFVRGPKAINVMIPSSASWYCDQISIKRISLDNWRNYYVGQWLGNGRQHKLMGHSNAWIGTETPCLYQCGDVQLVCGTDGVTYDQPCNLHELACYRRLDVVVAHEGVCRPGIDFASSRSAGKLQASSLLLAGIGLYMMMD